MYLANKNLFLSDEKQVLIAEVAEVAKLTFDCCYQGHSGPSGL